MVAGDRCRIRGGLEQVALKHQPDMVDDEGGAAEGHHGDGGRGDGRRAGARLAKEAVHGHRLPSCRFFGAGRSGASSVLRFTSLHSSRELRAFPDTPLACGKPGEGVPAAAGTGPSPPSRRAGPLAAPIRDWRWNRRGVHDAPHPVSLIATFGFSGADVVDDRGRGVAAVPSRNLRIHWSHWRHRVHRDRCALRLRRGFGDPLSDLHSGQTSRFEGVSNRGVTLAEPGLDRI